MSIAEKMRKLRLLGRNGDLRPTLEQALEINALRLSTVNAVSAMARGDEGWEVLADELEHDLQAAKNRVWNMVLNIDKERDKILFNRAVGETAERLLRLVQNMKKRKKPLEQERKDLLKQKIGA